MHKYILLLILLYFGNIEINAQDIQSNSIKKQTFILSSINNNISELELEIYNGALINFSQLDEFRFLNQRRKILFEKNQIFVELFSANELAEQFGKEVSPLTILPGNTYLPATFQLINWNEGYSIHPVYEKLNEKTH
jgi:hypothetical protein